MSRVGRSSPRKAMVAKDQLDLFARPVTAPAQDQPACHQVGISPPADPIVMTMSVAPATSPNVDRRVLDFVAPAILGQSQAANAPGSRDQTSIRPVQQKQRRRAQNAPVSAVESKRNDARSSPQLRTVCLTDLPEYPVLDQEVVDRSIAALPANKMWFTYAAIRECFGVSRATVARKVKRGLVPGIRFIGPRVLDDGPVRRFDRDQLRWLLLALRSRQ